MMNRLRRRVEMPARGKNFSVSLMARAWHSVMTAIVLLAKGVADRVAKWAATENLATQVQAKSATCMSRATAAFVARQAIAKTVIMKQTTQITMKTGIAKVDTLKPAEKARAAKPAVAIAKKALAVDRRNVVDQSPWSVADVAHHLPTVATMVADLQRWPATGMVAIAAG
jgi:hypothetical protein